MSKHTSSHKRQIYVLHEAHATLKAEVEDSKTKIQHKIEENVRLSLDLKHLGEIYVEVQNNIDPSILEVQEYYEENVKLVKRSQEVKERLAIMQKEKEDAHVAA